MIIIFFVTLLCMTSLGIRTSFHQKTDKKDASSSLLDEECFYRSNRKELHSTRDGHKTLCGTVTFYEASQNDTKSSWSGPNTHLPIGKTGKVKLSCSSGWIHGTFPTFDPFVEYKISVICIKKGRNPQYRLFFIQEMKWIKFSSFIFEKSRMFFKDKKTQENLDALKYAISNYKCRTLSPGLAEEYLSRWMKNLASISEVSEKTSYFSRKELSMLFRAYSNQKKILAILTMSTQDRSLLIDTGLNNPMKLVERGLPWTNTLGTLEFSGVVSCLSDMNISSCGYNECLKDLQAYQLFYKEIERSGSTCAKISCIPDFINDGIVKTRGMVIQAFGKTMTKQSKQITRSITKSLLCIHKYFFSNSDCEEWKSRINTTLEENSSDIISKYSLDDDQWKALCISSKNPISIIVGGPGTGKTRLLQSMVDFFDASKCIVSAPTGAACSRISSSTNIVSSNMTMTSKKLSNGTYDCSKKNIIILDEASMICEETLSIFLSSVREVIKKNKDNNCTSGIFKIIFFGDQNQLEPIGTGFPLRDLCNAFPTLVCSLRFNHRTEEGCDDILDFFDNIRMHGEDLSINQSNVQIYKDPMQTPFTLVQNKSFYVIQCPYFLFENCVFSLYSSFEDDKKNVQIVTHKNTCCRSLNEQIVSELVGKSTTSRIFKMGQRIIFTENHYHRNDPPSILCSDVCNGEIDIIRLVFEYKKIEFPTEENKCNAISFNAYSKKEEDDDDWLCVKYGKHSWWWCKKLSSTGMIPCDANGRIAILTKGGKLADFSILQHSIEYAYAITGHKSEGSEYDVVIIAISPQKYSSADIENITSVHFTKKLLYTMATRAKKILIIVEPTLFQKQILAPGDLIKHITKNHIPQERLTFLSEDLINAFQLNNHNNKE